MFTENLTSFNFSTNSITTQASSLLVNTFSLPLFPVGEMIVLIKTAAFSNSGLHAVISHGASVASTDIFCKKGFYSVGVNSGRESFNMQKISTLQDLTIAWWWRYFSQPCRNKYSYLLKSDIANYKNFYVNVN